MTLKSHISSRRRGLYSRLAQTFVAVLLLGFSLFALVLQVVPASASSISGTKYQNGQGPCKKKCPTVTASVIVTQPITVTIPITKTVPVTITVPVTPTVTRTATPTVGTTPGITPTPGTTPTNSLTPVGSGTPAPLSGTPEPGQTPIFQSTPTTGTGNGALPGGSGNNGNTPGGGSVDGLFTTVALIMGVLAFLLYLVPQRGTSLSILNKMLSLILPVSFLRRDR
jgi:hypothetical protein